MCCLDVPTVSKRKGDGRGESEREREKRVLLVAYYSRRYVRYIHEMRGRGSKVEHAFLHATKHKYKFGHFTLDMEISKCTGVTFDNIKVAL